MSKYKALVVDFDGTLVNHTYIVSPLVKQKIAELQKKSIFTIATGRGYSGHLVSCIKDLALTSPVIASGGSLIVDPQTDKIIHAEYVPEASVKGILTIFKEYHIDFFIERDNIFYASSPLSSGALGKDIEYRDLKELKTDKIAKMVVRARYTESLLDPIVKKLQTDYSTIHVIKMMHPSTRQIGLDVTSEKATKHLGVLRLAEMLKIKPSEMVGVGDGYNDYPLLTACGLKIAMANAPAELKAIADDICPTVDEDGIAYVIDKHFS